MRPEPGYFTLDRTPLSSMKVAREGYTEEMRLFTFGHGTLSEEQIGRLVLNAGIRRVVDVRTVPKSRAHPWVWREEMASWIPDRAQADYVWAPDLGGFRKPKADSHNTALRNGSFRGYADYMETPAFESALQQLLDTIAKRVTAAMCSETLWWRCHRRLIADAAVLLHGVSVEHLAPDGKTQAHVPTKGVRREGTHLRYDGIEPS